MKKLIYLIPIPVLLVIYLLFFRSGSRDTGPIYITAAVQRGNISVIVTATGSLQAVNTVQVGSQVSGTISALYADFNDRVKQGQILAQLDPAFLNAQVVQAQADLEKAIASAQLAQKDSERAASLYNNNMISESDKETSITNYQLALAGVKSAQANLDRLKTNLEYATIKSPIDGVVVSRNVDVGQTVAASLQAPTLFTIAQDLTKMQVLTSVDEADIGQVQNGQDVAFNVDAYPLKMFKGKVEQIRLAPEVVQNVVSYDVIIDVDNPDLLLKPGMTANVSILIDQRQDVLKVPAGAFRFHPIAPHLASASRGNASGRSARGSSSVGTSAAALAYQPGTDASDSATIWILDKQGKPSPVEVKVGLTDGTSTEVSSENLKEGEMVITGQEGAPMATDNQQVNPFLPRFGGRRR